MSKRISRDDQIKRAILQQNFRRALKLARHDAGESYRNNLKGWENSPTGVGNGQSYRNTRGNINEEFALADLGYTGKEPEYERQLKLKSAKIYNKIISKKLKGREALQYLSRVYRLPFEEWNGRDLWDIVDSNRGQRTKSEIAGIIYALFKKRSTI